MDKIFDTFLARDSLMMVKNQVNLPVISGAADYSQETLKANSSSASSVDWSWSVPSESVFLRRRALIKIKLQFRTVIQIPVANPSIPIDANVFSPGLNVCLQSMPFHRLVTNATTTINSSQVDCNVQNYLTAFLQMQNEEDLHEYSSFCPTMQDRILDYTQFRNVTNNAAGNTLIGLYNNNPFQGYLQSGLNKNCVTRGSHPINITSVLKDGGGGDPDSLISDPAGGGGNEAQTFTIDWNVDVVEPVIIEPWMFSKKAQNCDSFIGVNRVNLRYNLSSTLGSRVISSAYTMVAANAGNSFETTLTNVVDPLLIVEYLTANSTVLIPARVITPFVQVYDYISQSTVNNAATTSIQFQSLQLGEVPGKIIIFCRKKLSNLKNSDSDSVFPIQKISVSFNNRTSLLNAFTPDQLYLMSKRNGLNNVDYYQFLGYAQKYNRDYVAGASTAANNIYLSGGCLVLNPALDLSLGATPFISAGSMGQYNLSFTLDVSNPYGAAVDCEVVCLLLNERMLETSSGYSKVIAPSFNQQLVASTIDKAAVAYDSAGESEIMGGKNMSTIVARGIGGASRSAGASRSGGKSKLDSLLM